MVSHAPHSLEHERAPEPDVSHLVVEDDTPVDNVFSEKQQRLLTEPLYSSWRAPKGVPFLAHANVGLFTSVNETPLVPDVMLSLDVSVDPDFSQRKNKAYFVWQLGKLPEVVIEIVSNREGDELSDKLRKYERARVAYYVVFDPEHELSERTLHVFQARGGVLVQTDDASFPQVGLGLTLWQGSFEGLPCTWLRWTQDGELVPTGAERAERERERAERAEAELAALQETLARERGG